MNYIIVGTANKHKFEEYKELLKGQDAELKSLADYPDCPETIEDGKTFTENASKKALEVSNFCDAIAFADDSGLEIEALDNAPGIYSARYAENDSARIARVLKELEGKENRNARFVCVIAIAFNHEVIATFEGEIRGKIIDTPRGEAGFGYDPIFVPNGYEKTFAEMSSDEKNKISHRANAVAKALEFVEEQMSVLDEDFL